MPRERLSQAGGATPPRDLGNRIFSLQDWDFVSHETTLEIRRIFQKERAALAISWLQRTRRQVSLVMRTHAIGVRNCGKLQAAVELKLLLSYLSLVMLIDFLIGLVWLRGLRTRKLVRSTFQLTLWLRRAFAQCMAVVDPAYGQTLEKLFSQGQFRAEDR